MTIDEMVGQLLWIYADPVTATSGEEIEQAVRRGRAGGVYLFSSQLTAPDQAAMVVSHLQAAATVPLLVAVDAEAGLGRIVPGATHLPTMMALGATGDPDLAREAAQVTAAESRACGINTAFAPVVDVNVNPANPIINTRSFGGSPDLVARMGAAFVEGLQGTGDPLNGVLATGKHFPGHGDTSLDSHLQLDTVDQPRARLDAVELPPFRAAVDAGAAFIMTAHVVYPALDSAAPATLSRPILVDLLRGEMGFGGAVVTDAMSMHAIAHHYEAGEAAVQAVLAGSDLVLTPQWDRVHEALVTAAREGRLPEARLREAVGRVHTAKRRIFGPDLTPPAPIEPAQALAGIATTAHANAAVRIAAAAMTLVRGQVPHTGRPPLLLATRMERRFGPSVEEQVRTALQAVGWNDAELVMLDPAPDAAQSTEALARARAAGGAALLHTNLVTAYNPQGVLSSDALVALAQQISQAGVPLSVTSLGSPYVLPRFEGAQALLCSYSACDASVQATLRVLLGQEGTPGRLPVELA